MTDHVLKALEKTVRDKWPGVGGGETLDTLVRIAARTQASSLRNLIELGPDEECKTMLINLYERGGGGRSVIDAYLKHLATRLEAIAQPVEEKEPKP